MRALVCSGLFVILAIGVAIPASAATAQLISPQMGARAVDPFAPFSWTSVSGARCYYLQIGNSAGGSDVLDTGELAPSITSLIVTGLLDGHGYYVTLWTELNGVWTSSKGQIETAVESIMDPTQLRNTVLSTTRAVRGMTVGVSNTPTPGTPLAQMVAADGHAAAFCSDFARTLAQQLTQQRITARVRNMTFDGTSLEAHTTVEYRDTTLNTWVIADATFGVVFWNSSLGQGLNMGQLSQAVGRASWSTIPAYLEYATPSQAPNPQIYETNYYMDPILLYLNPVPIGSSGAVFPLAYNALAFVTVHSMSDIGKAGNWAFYVPGTGQSVTVIDPLRGTLRLTPVPSGFTNITYLNNGWTIPSPPIGLKVVTPNHYVF